MTQFKMKYEIIQDYIRIGNARSGQKLNGVHFLVAHDIGNGASTAYNNRSYFNNQQPLASAHTFIDDKHILEIVPLDEKAWHVQYNTTNDNKLFGADANDVAIGAELCWGGKINFQEAYRRFVWYHAYLCWKFNLDPTKHIVSHKILDPQRRSDPDNALNKNGLTYEQFLKDVKNEYDDCLRLESDENMKLTLNEWKMLGDSIDGWYRKGLISDYKWAEKAYKQEITLSELTWLNAIVFTRKNGIKV
ncbi:N-acetylmuramoyl-L-alanine amidase [Paenibacillus naphthalenovorans]|uniref:N-acetylmuramoyl-L-alanine amidase n=1 Tax=Paenibacillus naphthalenovorans TaxID=162209 RepID=A0A0U2UGN9_9BACL|nr:N-acetylmuramoyl-L-alanine amidase [Paenibacillus naphthalenovorans]